MEKLEKLFGWVPRVRKLIQLEQYDQLIELKRGAVIELEESVNRTKQLVEQKQLSLLSLEQSLKELEENLNIRAKTIEQANTLLDGRARVLDHRKEQLDEGFAQLKKERNQQQI